MAATRTASGRRPGIQRVYLEMDYDLLDRLDAYCDVVDRSRNGAIRFLLHKALRQYEEATGENTRSG